MTTEKPPLCRKAVRAGLFALLLPLAAYGLWQYANEIDWPEGSRGYSSLIPFLVFIVLIITTGFLMGHARRELNRNHWQMRGYRWLSVALLMIVFSVVALFYCYFAWWSKPLENRMLNACNLRDLGIAMHNYHNDYNHLPAQAIYSKDGKPLLSWRVAVLPYLEQEALYNEFHLDEPWYSEHNLKLLPRMPKVFRRPSSHRGGDTMTHYQVFVGPGAIFEDSKTRTLGEIAAADGTAYTILVADALEPVPWTKPEDLPFDPNGPTPSLNFVGYRGAAACFGDCSNRSARAPKNEKQLRLLRQLITWNGGEKEDTSLIVD